MTLNGIDYLGAGRYKNTVIAEHPRDFGFGAFLEFDGFGKTYDLFDQMGRLGVPFFHPQVMWQDNHQFRPEHVKVVEQRCKLLAPIANRYKDKNWFISPCCENELNATQFEPFAQAVLRQIPFAIVVNSPNANKGHRSTKWLNEFHGNDPRLRAGDGHSWDGTNIVDSDVTRIKNINLLYSMIWNSQCNGRRNTADKTPRAQRKFWPTPKQIDSWIYLYTHAKGTTSIPRGWIFKSHSDQHTVPPSGKDQKPCWVKLPRFKAIEVKALNGQLIDKAPYFGTFEGGGYRFYHSDWGFTLSEKAKRIQGHGLCNVFADGKKVGTVNLAFREGSYR
jgi:hypothetical protein